jgi:uncharacterized protein YndB with AHSA1/START domain
MTMTQPSFVYVTYIATTPEKVWQALVDPEVTRRYWVGVKPDSPAHENISDWTPGSRWEHRRVDSGAIDMAGKVVEHAPPRRLAYTWARPNEFDDESKHSAVSFDIEPLGSGLVRLTVTHDGLDGDPKMLAGISGGWPQVLSQLKTLLETGRTLPRGEAT